jgi:hypothetical protein
MINLFGVFVLSILGATLAIRPAKHWLDNNFPQQQVSVSVPDEQIDPNDPCSKFDAVSAALMAHLRTIADEPLQVRKAVRMQIAQWFEKCATPVEMWRTSKDWKDRAAGELRNQ